MSVTLTQSQPDQRRELLCLPLDIINGRLFGINATRVKAELRDRLIQYQRECYRVLADAFVNRTMPDEWIQANPDTIVARELQVILQCAGYYGGPLSGKLDTATRQALRQLVGAGNLEQRWQGEGDLIDRTVVAFLQDRFG